MERALVRYGLVFCLAVSGCMTLSAAKESLTDALDEYNSGVRWGRVDWMAEHVPKDKQEAYAKRQAPANGLQVTSCDVESIDMQKDNRRAVVTVRVDWYLLSQGRLHTSRIQQTWTHGDRWLVTELRVTGGAPYPPLAQARRPAI